MDADFLKLAQRKGWTITAVDGETCLAACPNAGCAVVKAFRIGGEIPDRAPSFPLSTDVEFLSYENARQVLRDRREELGLTIEDVEECAGTASTQLAKCERENWQDNPAQSRIPNIQTFKEWAEALGLELVLRPTDLPPMTLRRISETRHLTASRQRRNEIERARRARDVR